MSSRRHETTALPKSLTQAGIEAGEKKEHKEKVPKIKCLKVEEACGFVIGGRSQKLEGILAYGLLHHLR